MGEVINILIRHKPPRRITPTLESISMQTYRHVNISIYQDNAPAPFPFHYNLFCNELKDKVTDGWFFFLDDDDFLNSPTALADIAPHLTNPNEAVIVQFKRGEHKVKPRNGEIISGKVGMPCLILHHSQKHIADIQAEDNGDFLWIKAVTSKIPYKFVPKILVNSPCRNYGV